MFKNHIKVIFRNLAKNKAFSFINISGLAISLAICLLSISFLTEIQSYDKFNTKSDRIYRLTTHFSRGGGQGFKLASSSIYAAKRIQENNPEIENVTMLTYGFEGRAQTQKNDYITISGHWASESFFSIFSFDFIEGNPETALREPNSLVITQRLASSIFGEEQAFGQTIKLEDDKNYLVTGIIENVPVNSHLQFEALCSFITKENEQRENPRFASWGSAFQNYTYLLLPESHDADALESKLVSFSNIENEKLEGRKLVLGLQALEDIVIGTPLVNGIGFSIEKQTVQIILGLTLIILLSACFNYTNLSLARSFKRTREIGVRKALGSKSQLIFRLFLTEALVISLLALVIAYFIFELVKSQALSFDSELQSAISFTTSPLLYAQFIGFTLVIGLIAGLFPAMILSKTKTTNALKGVLMKVQSSTSWNLRKVLLVVQYTLSLGFILAATISYNQYRFALDYDLGYETTGVINVTLDGHDPQIAMNEFSKIPDVVDISKSMLTFGTGRHLDGIGSLYGSTDSTAADFNIVDDKYLTLHEFEFIAGDNFQSEEQTNGTKTTIVNEKFVEYFGITDPMEVIGKMMTFSGERYRIQGVVKDFHSNTLSEPIVPFVFLNSTAGANPLQGLNLKIVTEDLAQVNERIEAVWSKIDPIYPLEAEFYDEQIKTSYVSFFSMFKIVSSLAIVAISIASLGLLGMAIYTAETKLKDISIRKILGAPSLHLAMYMSKGLLLPLLLAAIIAVPLVYYVFDQIVLTEIIYRAPIGFLEIAGGVLLIFLIAALTTSGQVLKTIKTNPSKTLRTE